MTAEPSAADVKRPFSPPRFAATGSARDPAKAPADQENRQQQQQQQQRVDDEDADEDDDEEEDEDGDEDDEEEATPPSTRARTAAKPRATATTSTKKPRKAKEEPGDDDDDKKSGAGAAGANKKARRELPPHTVAILKGWMLSPEHVKHPYPTDEDKQMLLKKTGINMKQLTNWFTNARKRIWKPMMRREHSRQLQSAIEYEKTRPRDPFAPTGASQPHHFREGEFPVARGGPGVVRHSFDAGSLGPPRQQMPPPPSPFDPYAPRSIDGREVPGYPPPPSAAGFVPRVVRSASEALPGAHIQDDDYMDAMRIRKRVHERSPDGVETEAQGSADKRFRRSTLLSPRSLKILQDWVSTHPDYPFPTDTEKLQLSRDTGLDVQQIELWFTTNRERISAANFAVQNGAPGLSPSRRALPGRSIPSRDNPMFPPPMYSAGGEHHRREPHALRSIPSNGNPMFPPRPTAAPMQQRSSIPGNGNPQFPPPPSRRELPEGYYPPPSYGSGQQYGGHAYNGDAARHVRSMSISTSQLMRQQPRPLVGSASQPQQSSLVTPGAPSAVSGLPSLTNRGMMPRVANSSGPTMGQPRDGRSHTLDMGLFTDARRRKMNFQDILASTTSVPAVQPQLSLRQAPPPQSSQQQQPPVSRPLSSVSMAENGSHPHSVASGSAAPEQQLQVYSNAMPAYGGGVQSFERPHISGGCPRCGARPGACGCAVTDDAQQQRRIV